MLEADIIKVYKLVVALQLRVNALINSSSMTESKLTYIREVVYKCFHALGDM